MIIENFWITHCIFSHKNNCNNFEESFGTKFRPVRTVLNHCVVKCNICPCLVSGDLREGGDRILEYAAYIILLTLHNKNRLYLYYINSAALRGATFELLRRTAAFSCNRKALRPKGDFAGQTDGQTKWWTNLIQIFLG